MFETEKYPNEKEVKVRIKEGACISQDFRFMRWPVCLMPTPQGDPNENDLNPNPNMIFTASWNDKYWDCWAPGFGSGVHGREGSYGNGSIFVSDKDGVEIVTDDVELTKEHQIDQLINDFANNTGFSEETRKTVKLLQNGIKAIRD